MSFFPRSTPPSIAPLPGNGCRSSLPDERFEDEVNCPSCKISSMAAMTSGEVEVDRCRTCGAAWFDPGEIRELTQGRLRPADFELMGVPVFRCRRCGGMLVSRRSVTALSARYKFQRDHAALYEALGTSMAEEVRRRENRRLGPYAASMDPGEIPVPGLPVLVPLADKPSASALPPLAVYGILLLTVLLFFLAWIGVGGMDVLPGRLALPSGAGFSGVPRFALLLTPFLHGGIVPLAVGCLFLFVLGDNVEDRLGRVPFLLFSLFCGAVAGAAHVLWGKAGMPDALGSAGSVAGVLGAYLVFFPDVPIDMYGMGRVVTVPAYLFACAWAVSVFLWGWGPGPLSNLLNPGPYSLAGHLAGFGTGAACAALWRSVE